MNLWLAYREWRFVGRMLKHMRSLPGVRKHHLQRSICEDILEGWLLVSQCRFGDSYLTWDDKLAASIVDEDHQYESANYAGA